MTQNEKKRTGVAKKKPEDEIKVPESVKRLAGVQYQLKLASEKARLQEQKEVEAKRRLAFEKRIKEGLLYAREIFKWAQAFMNSKTGRKLIQTGHRYVDGIFFFDEQLEGLPRRSLGVGKKGIWWRGSGCGASEAYVRSPKDLAGNIDTKILREACKWIDSGKIWECVKRHFNY